MCNRGEWRGFHSRYLKTPSGEDSPLVIMEQCTSCGSYRAKNAEGLPYVVPDQQERQQQEEARQGDKDMLPDPEAEDGGSVWGPDSTTSSDNDSW